MTRTAHAKARQRGSECDRCNGGGIILVRGQGHGAGDPENDHDDVCPDCKGSGIDKEETNDEH